MVFAVAYGWFAVGPDNALALAPAFVLAGIGIGCVETAEHAAAAALAPQHLRGSTFGMLAAIQSIGNLTASTIAGILWTAISPAAAFLFLAVAMTVAVPLIATSQRTHRRPRSRARATHIRRIRTRAGRVAHRERHYG